MLSRVLRSRTARGTLLLQIARPFPWLTVGFRRTYSAAMTVLINRMEYFPTIRFHSNTANTVPRELSSVNRPLSGLSFEEAISQIPVALWFEIYR